jgi:hypothetical protein
MLVMFDRITGILRLGGKVHEISTQANTSTITKLTALLQWIRKHPFGLRIE